MFRCITLEEFGKECCTSSHVYMYYVLLVVFDTETVKRE